MLPMKQWITLTIYSYIFQSDIAVITIYILSRILKLRMASSITILFIAKKIIVRNQFNNNSIHSHMAQSQCMGWK